MVNSQKSEVQESYAEVVKFNIVTLAWKDPDKKDELIIKDKKPFKDEMAARAKGTTIYELIDAFCPSKEPDAVKERISSVFPEKPGAHYGDYSKTPEFFNDEVVKELQDDVNAYIKQKCEEKKKELEAEAGKKNASEGASGSGKEGE